MLTCAQELSNLAWALPHLLGLHGGAPRAGPGWRQAQALMRAQAHGWAQRLDRELARRLDLADAPPDAAFPDAPDAELPAASEGGGSAPEDAGTTAATAGGGAGQQRRQSGDAAAAWQQAWRGVPLPADGGAAAGAPQRRAAGSTDTGRPGGGERQRSDGGGGAGRLAPQHVASALRCLALLQHRPGAALMRALEARLLRELPGPACAPAASSSPWGTDMLVSGLQRDGTASPAAPALRASAAFRGHAAHACVPFRMLAGRPPARRFGRWRAWRRPARRLPAWWRG